MNKNVSWSRLILVWFGVILLTFAAYRLVRIQTYDLQQDVMIQQDLLLDEGMLEAITKTSLISNDNFSDIGEPLGPIPISDHSALKETGESFFQIFDTNINEQPLDQWMTLAVQNHLKINLPLTPEKSRDWEWALSGDKIRIQFRSELDARKDILSRKKQGKYSLQLGSFESEEFVTAVNWAMLLTEEGYYTYLQRTEEKYNKKYRYRVRIGFFKNTEDALEEGLKIQESLRKILDFPKKFWPVIPDSREMSRELVNLKQPRNKPWVIELPSYLQQHKAFEDMARFAPLNDFSFLSRKIDGKSLEPEYRLRLGFYETSKEAQLKKNKIARRWKVFKKARILRLDG